MKKVLLALGLGALAACSDATSPSNANRDLNPRLTLATVRAAVAIAGPDRLLWGSDAPLLEPSFVLGTYRDAGLAPDALERVFWGNAAALFGL